MWKPPQVTDGERLFKFSSPTSSVRASSDCASQPFPERSSTGESDFEGRSADVHLGCSHLPWAM